MRDRLDQRQKRLWAAADEVLHYLWDPIGVAGIPQARSEYHDYVPQIFALLERGDGEREVASALAALARELGAAGRAARHRHAASVLVEWRGSLANETAERPIGRRSRVNSPPPPPPAPPGAPRP